MKTPRFLRLLPGVVLLGTGLLVIKTSGLVHDAYAQAASAEAGQTAPAEPLASAAPDYAGGSDDQIGSASEADVLTSLGKRRRELDARQAALDTQQAMLTAAENRVDAKIGQLKQLQNKIAALLVQRDEAQKKQIDALVKTYSTMKPKDAARIFNALPDDVLLPVAAAMKADVLALVLAGMASDNAKALTVKLANRLALPQTADAVAPASAPSTPPPAPAASASAAPATKAATKTSS
jgi:flagellar motility protein MotE (MotC chaperone)